MDAGLGLDGIDHHDIISTRSLPPRLLLRTGAACRNQFRPSLSSCQASRGGPSSRLNPFSSYLCTSLDPRQRPSLPVLLTPSLSTGRRNLQHEEQSFITYRLYYVSQCDLWLANKVKMYWMTSATQGPRRAFWFYTTSERQTAKAFKLLLPEPVSQFPEKYYLLRIFHFLPRTDIEYHGSDLGLPVVVADTSGLRETNDLVESIGVQRARCRNISFFFFFFMLNFT
jgi:hypothetical protein